MSGPCSKGAPIATKRGQVNAFRADSCGGRPAKSAFGGALPLSVTLNLFHHDEHEMKYPTSDIRAPISAGIGGRRRSTALIARCALSYRRIRNARQIGRAHV